MIRPTCSWGRHSSRDFPDDSSSLSLCVEPETGAVFGLGEVPNPAEAHAGYDHDERVIAIVAHGIGHEGSAEVVRERCTWMETINTN